MFIDEQGTVVQGDIPHNHVFIDRPWEQTSKLRPRLAREPHHI